MEFSILKNIFKYVNKSKYYFSVKRGGQEVETPEK